MTKPRRRRCSVSQDAGRDGDLDLDDFAEWATHMTGPCAAKPCWPSAYSAPCGSAADFDDDGEVDLRDYATFEQSHTASP